jgi:hypothetical protein
VSTHISPKLMKVEVTLADGTKVDLTGHVTHMQILAGYDNDYGYASSLGEPVAMKGPLKQTLKFEILLSEALYRVPNVKKLLEALHMDLFGEPPP